MPYRKVLLVTNEVYHIVSRGIAQNSIFRNKKDYLRILNLVDFYRHSDPPLRFSHYYRLLVKKKENFLNDLRKNSEKLVEIFTFCFMPNHTHFLLRQVQDKGISTFMRNLQNSYARYFNTKYRRSGALFQAMFKAVRIETDDQLLHVSRYIHLNPVTSYLIEKEDLIDYPWSSFPEYMNKRSLEFVNSDFILVFFKKRKHYKHFVFDQADYQRELQKIKQLILEE